MTTELLFTQLTDYYLEGFKMTVNSQEDMHSPNGFWFPISKQWDFYLYEIANMVLNTGDSRELIAKNESGWLTWLLMRTNNRDIRLKVQIETPDEVVVPWSYTPFELFTDALIKWLPRYDTFNNIYVVDAQFNPWIPYNITIRLIIANESTAVATVSRIKLMRIKLKEKLETPSKGNK